MRMMYVAVVEVETTRQFDVEEAMRTLVDHNPVLGVSPRGWVEVRIRFPASGLAHACATAAAMARAAIGADAIACQVMTEQEHVARNGPTPRAASAGRHAAEGVAPSLPRQATGSWDREARERGRHSA